MFFLFFLRPGNQDEKERKKEKKRKKRKLQHPGKYVHDVPDINTWKRQPVEV